MDKDELPEIDVDANEFAVQPIEAADERWEGTVLLYSKARYFPVPVCEWFEICDGRLFLTPDRVIFEPRYTIMKEKGQRRSGRFVIYLKQILSVQSDQWWHIPCLRIVTQQKAYRYGWTGHREEPESIFEPDEWIGALNSLLAQEH